MYLDCVVVDFMILLNITIFSEDEFDSFLNMVCKKDQEIWSQKGQLLGPVCVCCECDL